MENNNQNQMLAMGSWICFGLGMFWMDVLLIPGIIMGYYHLKGGGSNKPFLTNVFGVFWSIVIGIIWGIMYM